MGDEFEELNWTILEQAVVHDIPPSDTAQTTDRPLDPSIINPTRRTEELPYIVHQLDTVQYVDAHSNLCRDRALNLRNTHYLTVLEKSPPVVNLHFHLEYGSACYEIRFCLESCFRVGRTKYTAPQPPAPSFFTINHR
ncbi:hypothetical protein PRIPAC_71147 [Pristionchus pacificus]|uniref:Uncharacterized protein n=1 Tax=Pristionchus pacificus TaxID=54126 RepID=A0A2A6C8W0_PRIPA|nr:hypothetical protein PRIPAC_71147 [Pristionchus pacificus]|eukprot:PDM74614.1 hypothetical protein PRIPAC_41970 [Pristionchus pacificus]